MDARGYTDLINQITESVDIPVLAKEGAIIPMSKNEKDNTVENPKDLELLIFRGNNEFSLYGVNHPRHEKELHGDGPSDFEHRDEGGWGRITITATDKKKDDSFIVKCEIIEL